jgi:hypothetical protein
MTAGQTDTHHSSSNEPERLIRPFERAVDTQVLLASGALSAIVFAVALLIEGARRPGYVSAYHTGSALSLGDHGWIQRANFLQLGLGSIAFAVGVRRELGDRLGSILLGIFGLGMMVSGTFVMDRMRGYPPGTPSGTPSEFSRRHQIHDMSGPIAFLALFGACLAIARRLSGIWRIHTLCTAVVGFSFTIGTAVAWQRDALKTGLIQRGLLFVYLGWITSLGTHLIRRARTGNGAAHYQAGVKSVGEPYHPCVSSVQSMLHRRLSRPHRRWRKA